MGKIKERWGWMQELRGLEEAREGCGRRVWTLKLLNQGSGSDDEQDREQGAAESRSEGGTGRQLFKGLGVHCRKETESDAASREGGSFTNFSP